MIVLYGDTPFVTPETLERMLAARAAADVVVLGFDAADPDARYGRLVTDGRPAPRIVEWKDADAATRAIRLSNSGVLCAEGMFLFDLLAEVGTDNAAGEYYLTDVVGIADGRGMTAPWSRCDESRDAGHQLAGRAAGGRGRLPGPRPRRRARRRRVDARPATRSTSRSTPPSGATRWSSPSSSSAPASRSSPARASAPSRISKAATSARGATVGPFARLRPGAELAEDVHVGNFVEIKNAHPRPKAPRSTT